MEQRLDLCVFMFFIRHSYTNPIEIVKKKRPNSLLAVTFRTLKWPLLSIALPRICLIGFNFSQPFLINRAISFSLEPESQHTTNVGYGLIFAYVLVYTGIAVSSIHAIRLALFTNTIFLRYQLDSTNILPIVQSLWLVAD